jgi:transmembrane sensor
MTEKIPYRLISKNLCGESSLEEDEELFKWVVSDLSHRSFFEECIQSLSERHISVSSDEIETRIKKLHRGSKQFAFWKVAASLVLLAAVSFLLFRKFEKTVPLTHTVQHIVLPDGSDVWLNAGSSISFDAISFRKSRVITLEGEAFVHVSSDVSPFLILYGGGTIARLSNGAINIRSYPNEREQTAVVSDGIVAFTDHRGVVVEGTTDQELISTTEHGILSCSSNRNINFSSWLTGVYAFNQTPLSVIIANTPSNVSQTDLSGIDQQQLISGVFELDRDRPLTDLLRKLNERKHFQH